MKYCYGSKESGEIDNSYSTLMELSLEKYFKGQFGNCYEDQKFFCI